MITVYSRPGCGACDLLKSFLKKEGLAFEDVDGSTAEGLTQMRTEGIWLSYFPAMQVGDRLYQYADLFGEKGELLDIKELIG